jgi:hypothetical protein
MSHPAPRTSPATTARQSGPANSDRALSGGEGRGFPARAALTLATRSPGADPISMGGPDAGMAREERTEALAAVQAELAALRVAVARVGTNLNQAMAAWHATAQPPVWLQHVVELCGQALATVDEAAKGVHGRLRR